MKNLIYVTILVIICLTSCSSQKKLAYLNNITDTSEEQYFSMDVPDYKIQIRDILYITIKSMTPDGKISDFISSSGGNLTNSAQADAGGYLYGYDVNSEGCINLPAIGLVKIEGLTLEESKKYIQTFADKIYKNSTVECKLLSFKFTVIGEVRSPGAYVNYNNYLTVLEAIGRAGGVGDYGNRTKVLVIRPINKGTKTFTLNLQDKNILSSKAYFLLPNDIVIVQPLRNKIFSMNIPTISFIVGTMTSVLSTTLLLINYLKK